MEFMKGQDRSRFHDDQHYLLRKNIDVEQQASTQNSLLIDEPLEYFRVGRAPHHRLSTTIVEDDHFVHIRVELLEGEEVPNFEAMSYSKC
jgi:hypothetical protein